MEQHSKTFSFFFSFFFFLFTEKNDSRQPMTGGKLNDTIIREREGKLELQKMCLIGACRRLVIANE